MNDLLDALTDKEKETLRLIVRGHDAKSAARDLDLSVHTINERLRTARRKLDVTSSREAARLLFESEGGAYENLGSKELGDASSAHPDDHASIPQPARKRVLWIGGIAVMFVTTLVAALALSGTFSSDRPIGDPATPIEAAQLQEFEASARDWLALVDASDWEASYAAAGKAFREPNTVEGWQRASSIARVPLGAVVERRTETAEYVNAPPGGYVVVKFQTDFEQGRFTESVTLENEDGAWRVVGYFIS